MRRRAYLGVIVAAAAFLTAFTGWVALAPDDHAATPWIVNLASTVAPLFAAAGAAFSARRCEGRARRAWALLGLGFLSWGLGQATWSVYELALGREVPFPSLADVGYLGLIPFVAAGMLLLHSAPRGARARVRAAVDGMVVAGSFLFVSWTAVLAQIYADTEAGLVEKVIALAYPAGDAIILTILVIAARTGRPETRVRFGVLAAALVMFSLADSAFTFLSLAGTYETGSIIDPLWLGGFLVAGLAGFAPGPRIPAGAAAKPDGAALSVLPFFPVMLAGAILVIQGVNGIALDRFQLWTACIVTLFTVWRSFLLLDDLREANARLRDAEAERKTLLSSVCHEMGTPLTSLRIQSDLIAARIASEKFPEKRQLDIVKRSLVQLSRLAEDLRDVAQIEQARLRIDARPVDARAVVAGVVESMREASHAKDVRLTLRDGTTTLVHADEQRLMQVMTNLVSNAIKFTPSGGDVEVEVAEGGEEVRFVVRDTGRGLDPEQRAAIFRPFSRPHEKEPGAPPGTGLGLYICSGIVEQHGGRIWCESEGKGKGTTFQVALPKTA